MENPTQSAESSPDETVPAVWWTTAGMVPAHVPPPPSKPPAPPANGRRSFMLALCGLTVALAHGPAFTVLPSDHLVLDRFIEKARSSSHAPATATPAHPQCPEVATEPPPARPEAHAVAATPPPSPEPKTKTKTPKPKPKPKKPLDPFLRKAKLVQRDPVQQQCAQLVRPGHIVTVRVRHDINAMTGRVAASPENPTGSDAENCVIKQVKAAQGWPTDTARPRLFKYRVKGRPTR